MTKHIKIDHKILLECWQAVQETPNNPQPYIKQQKILEWTNRVLSSHQIPLTQHNLPNELHQYMKEVHELDRAGITNVQFKYEEAVDFLEWLWARFEKLQLQDEPVKQQGEGLGESRADGGKMGNSSVIKQSPKVKEKGDGKQDDKNKNNDGLKQNSSKVSIKNNHSKLKQHPKEPSPPKNQPSPQKPPEQQQQQQTYLYPSNQHPSPNQHENQFAEHPNPHPNPHPDPQPPISKNYLEYLTTIFDHYCRMSYATGNDPTFEQIQQKTQIMTINKFMIFCKEFGVVKLNGMGRQVLVEIFKKNSEFYKEMSYQQFVAVLVKIAYLVYSPQHEGEQSQKSKQFEQLLLFLQVNNFAAFKKKIQSLNISYRPKVPAQASQMQAQPKKAVPSKYKFTQAGGGKSEEEVKEELDERKRIRSENKLKVLDKRVRNVTSKKDIIKIREERNEGDREQVKTSQPTRKLGPPLPPARKISNTNLNNKSTQQAVTGYANIHKLKLMGKQGQVDSKMKLNSIVEEAKRIINQNLNGQQYSEYPPSNRMSSYGRDTPYSNYSQNRMHTNIDYNPNYRDLAESEHSNYSQRDLLDENPGSQRRSYAPHGHHLLEKRVLEKDRDGNGNGELKGIINNQSDQDQYLEEHLNREKKTGQINQRIQKKIKEFELKSLNS